VPEWKDDSNASSPLPYLAVAAHGMSVRMILTEGAMADCTQARLLVADINANTRWPLSG
jgi:hypothetical protein